MFASQTIRPFHCEFYGYEGVTKMVLLGTLVNGLCIIIGTILGLIFTNIPDRMKETALQGIGLVVAIIGIQMAIQADNVVLILLSLLIGSLIGTGIQLEDKLNIIGKKLETRLNKKGNGKRNLTEGFVTATLIFVIGAMAIVGAIDGGFKE